MLDKKQAQREPKFMSPKLTDAIAQKPGTCYVCGQPINKGDAIVRVYLPSQMREHLPDGEEPQGKYRRQQHDLTIHSGECTDAFLLTFAPGETYHEMRQDELARNHQRYHDKKQAQKLPVNAKNLNALANMIKRNQYKPTEEDVAALSQFILTRKRAGDVPVHLLRTMIAKGYRSLVEAIVDKIRDLSPDDAINLEDFPLLQELGVLRKQILAVLEKKWNTSTKQAVKDIRKQVLATLKKKWNIK